MSTVTISARAARIEEIREADPLIESLPFAEEALDALARASGVPAARFADEVAWSAAVDVEGTTVLVRADGESWAILAPGGAELGDAMAAARRLHGLLGTKTSDWDQDR